MVSAAVVFLINYCLPCLSYYFLQLTGFGFLIRDVLNENSMIMRLDDCRITYEASKEVRNFSPRQFLKTHACLQLFMQGMGCAT
jgi:hypothetical protein